MNIPPSKPCPLRAARQSFASVVFISLLCHLAFFALIVATAKAVYKSREYERPPTFDLVKLSQIFEIPEEPKLAAPPKIKAAAPSQIARPQPVLAQPQPAPVEEKNPLPSITKTAAPAPAEPVAPAAPAAPQTAAAAAAGPSAGDGVSTDKVYEAGMVDEQPVVVKKIEPFYPEFVKDQGIAGIVRAQVTIDEKGNVMEVKILSSPHELLTNEVMKAVSRWKYKPGRFKGIAVKVRNRPIEIEFKLE
jgi:protein TonB